MVDVVYAMVGTLTSHESGSRTSQAPAEWYAYGSWPDPLPPARDYWMVYRYDGPGVPDLAAAAALAHWIPILRRQARVRNLHLAGVQLDVDSPTSSLPLYARFLADLRKSLPAGCELSITALLDWFRSGTAVSEVIRQVDEFVPQFYDLGTAANRYNESAIAAPIDAGRWSPVFHRFGKRFRIGISTFGRTRLIQGRGSSQAGNWFFGDISPLDIAVNPAFDLLTSHTQAGEQVLDYRAARQARISYNSFEPGDTVQFTTTTPDSVGAAVRGARAIQGANAGVVFFRWPAVNESTAMQPDEVLEAAGTQPSGGPRNRVHRVPGGCAAVECVDVYLESAMPLSPKRAHYRIHASTPLEYFVPEKNMPVRLAGDSDLEVTLPPFCARGRLYLGRAVSLKPGEFTV